MTIQEACFWRRNRRLKKSRRTTDAGHAGVEQIDNVRAIKPDESGKKIEVMQVTETLVEGLKHEF